MSFEVSADAYDRFMGRFSLPLATRFADLVDPEDLYDSEHAAAFVVAVFRPGRRRPAVQYPTAISHDRSVVVDAPSPGNFAGRCYGNRQVKAELGKCDGRGAVSSTR